MWTAPEVRRGGVGRRLVHALVRWAAEEASAHTVELWVTAGNLNALALYTAAGFELTGDRAPLPSNLALEELRMRRRLRRLARPALWDRARGKSWASSSAIATSGLVQDRCGWPT